MQAIWLPFRSVRYLVLLQAVKDKYFGHGIHGRTRKYFS
jgi:hypothetical protein